MAAVLPPPPQVYLSTVPPFMKPAKVKHLLSQYGVITRLYLVEEGALNHQPATIGQSGTESNNTGLCS